MNQQQITEEIKKEIKKFIEPDGNDLMPAQVEAGRSL